MEALADRIGGLLLVGFEGASPSAGTLDFIAGTAGAILFRANIDGPDTTVALTSALQAAAHAAGRGPLLIAVDQEGSVVERLGAAGSQPPSAMALGAAGDIELTSAVYARIGAEVAALGITLDLAPVADVNTNPLNPVIGLRSFGDDAHAVARHVTAAVRGLHDAGVGSCAKHFPGHGDTADDSHTGLPTVGVDLERLRACEFVPFRAAIAAGVDVVMSAHVALPDVDASGVPATLSRVVLTDILRHELSFEGVICTDDMEMQAVAQRYPLGEAAVLAVQAGADLVLFSHSIVAARAARDALGRALREGRLDPERVAASLARVDTLRAKYSRGAHGAVEFIRPSADADVFQEASRRAITLLRRAGEVPPLPASPDARILVINCIAGGGKPSSARVSSAFGKALESGGAHVSEQLRSLDPAGHEYKQALLAAASADAFVIVTRDALRHPLQARLAADLALYGKPAIAVAALGPYDAAVLPDTIAVLASFGDDDAALAAAADVLLGRSQANGRAPVAIAAPHVASSAP
jgi:beta-N-acetylhexosaminidase